MNKRGPYKTQTLRILRDRGIPVGSILDVGVLSGTSELTKIWPNILHILFEPVAEFAEQIRKNYSSIPHELHTVAVSDSSGSVNLQLMGKFEGQSISHSNMTDAVSSSDTNVRTVSMMSLDDFLSDRQYNEPFLLKIDIDGQELKVLKGAEETLKKCSIVIVECDKGQIAKRIDFLQSAGFTLFDLCEPCYYDQSFWQCDAVFIRSSLHQHFFKQLTDKVEHGMYEIFRDDCDSESN